MKQIFTHAVAILTAGSSYAQGGFNKVVDALNPVTTFTSPGIYKGAAWIDFDNDNDLDLFASPNFLFQNNNGVFVSLNNPFGLIPNQNVGGSSWADLDGDGYIDCIISQYPSAAFINNGNLSFTDISSQLSNFNNYPSWGCAIGNWNLDAYPDFVFVHAANFHPAGPYPSKLYLNTNSSVIPQLITGYALTDSTRPYTVPYWSDYDLDGDMDLFVASGPVNFPGLDFCYKNLKVETGLDTLERMSSELFASQLQDGQGYNFIDYDNDGDLDLCLTNYIAVQTRFYVNNNGTYSLVSVPFESQIGNLSSNWGDFDNDGDLDVIITSDQVPAKYYPNDGNGTFGQEIVLGGNGCAGITNGDYDNDGDLDVFIHGSANARALFRNDSVGTGNHWINIKCNGTTSNKSALGTIVRLKATINGNAYWQMREINAQNSFQSQNDLRVHFGLGDAAVVDSLVIRYPSGITENFMNVNADDFYCNDEGSGTLCMVTLVNENKISGKGIDIFPNPASREFRIQNSELRIEKVEIYDLLGEVVYESGIIPLNSGKESGIDVSSLTTGIYFIRLKTGDKTFSQKLIISR